MTRRAIFAVAFALLGVIISIISNLLATSVLIENNASLVIVVSLVISGFLFTLFLLDNLGNIIVTILSVFRIMFSWLNNNAVRESEFAENKAPTGKRRRSRIPNVAKKKGRLQRRSRATNSHYVNYAGEMKISKEENKIVHITSINDAYIYHKGSIDIITALTKGTFNILIIAVFIITLINSETLVDFLASLIERLTSSLRGW